MTMIIPVAFIITITSWTTITHAHVFAHRYDRSDEGFSFLYLLFFQPKIGEERGIQKLCGKCVSEVRFTHR